MSFFAPGEAVEGLAGAYVIEGTHGEGAFGVTYRARRRPGGEPVLAKALRVERLKSWKALELFEREAATLRNLAHPNIPAYYDFFAYGNGRAAPASSLSSFGGPGPVTLVLVQQFIAGRSLQQAVDGGLRWTGAEAAGFLRQMLGVLAYLHGLSPPVVHRDINPKNVILAPDGRPHLVDFGAIQDRIRSASSVASTSVGTMGYMPLEQVMGAARPASDLYALAMTVVAVVSGRAPTDLPVDERTGKVEHGAFTAGLPPEVRAALDAMAEPIVGNRTATAREALDVLDGKARRRGAGRRAPLVVAGAIAVAAGAASLGVASVVASRGAPAVAAAPPAPPAPPAAVAPTSPTPPEPPAPPPPPAVAPGATLEWRGAVAGGSGQAPAPGTPCVLRADVSGRGGPIEVANVRLVCGRAGLYDSADELNGISSLSYGVAEVAAPGEAGAFRYALRYLDQGTRTGARTQVALDTRAREATATRDAPPAFRAVVRLDELSAVRRGEPLGPPRPAPLAAAVERRAVVASVRGRAPVKPGDACALRIERASGAHNCRARLTCGEAVLYGGGEGGYNDCAVRAGAPTGFADKGTTTADGDPRAEVDIAGGRASLADETLDESYGVEFVLL